MPRLMAISFQEYRMHRLELRDGGRGDCAVVIHPPPGRGDARVVLQDDELVTLGVLLGRAKASIDAVLGPRPPFAPKRPGLLRSGPRRRPHSSFGQADC